MGSTNKTTTPRTGPRKCIIPDNIGDSDHTYIKSAREEGFGAAFKFYISKENFKLIGYFFVDDSTIYQVSPYPLNT